MVIWPAVLVLCLVMSKAYAENNTRAEIKRYSAVASKPSGLILPDEMKKIQFKFSNSEISAWVRENGEWYIEGLISHNKFFCADYSLGIRFGEGSAGCIDVKWLTEEQYATHRKQCNNVNMFHSGYETNPKIVPLFGKITCAQAIVKCEGACE